MDRNLRSAYLGSVLILRAKDSKLIIYPLIVSFLPEFTASASEVKELFLIVDTMVEFIEISDEVLLLERVFGLLVSGILLLELGVELFPFFVIVLAIIFVLLDRILLPLVGIHSECLLESEWIDLLEDGLEGDQRLLQDLVPMLVSKLSDYWDEHWESLVLVSL